jgi:hypothetical protein
LQRIASPVRLSASCAGQYFLKMPNLSAPKKQ